MDRKQLKRHARSVLKKHYALLVMSCLLLSLLGVSFNSSTDFLQLPTLQPSPVAMLEAGDTGSLRSDPVFGTSSVYTALISGDAQAGKEQSQVALEQEKETDKNFGGLQIAYKRGALSSLVSSISSGSALVSLFSAIHSVGFLSSNAADIIFTLLSAAVYLFAILFVVNVFEVIITRVIMEARVYKRVPLDHGLWVSKTKNWFNVALGLLWRDLFQVLWSLTIVGYFIKHYSYRLVPYILAENPSIKPREALQLSIRMMKGHKWECCKLDLSFALWFVLTIVTQGIVGLFFFFPYFSATGAEYYAYVREQAQAQNVEGAEALNDTYLHEKASNALLTRTYLDVIAASERAVAPQIKRKTKVGQFFADVFGVAWHKDATETQYREYKETERVLKGYRSDMAAESYPVRLYPLLFMESPKRIFSLQPERHYSVTSLALIFFALSVFGWLFEVGMHYITDGEFVNRGVLFGPWVPIYGIGIVLFLMVLNKFRDRPWLLFLLAMVVAGCLEYFTSWGLEQITGGLKWWDYSGYFLNLNGRICAEGLLTFGLGGLAGTYVVAPTLDNLFHRVRQKSILVIVCAALIALFATDCVYSSFHPNTGEGVTSVTGMSDSSS